MVTPSYKPSSNRELLKQTMDHFALAKRYIQMARRDILAGREVNIRKLMEQ